MSKYPKKVRIVEVGPRDGLQNEKTPVSVADKVKFINLLTEAGLQTIEAGAFVSPRAVPQMADTGKVYATIHKKDGVAYPVLVPNRKGMEAAVAARVKEVAIFAAPSDAFSIENTNRTVVQSFEDFKPVIQIAKDNGIKVRGYVSCVLGCPYQGAVTPQAVADVSKKLVDMGCYEISLGDTIGVGTPEATRRMLREVKKSVSVEKLAVHFHDTNGRAVENIRVALEEGVAVVDSSASGLGGCPYARGATGNVATEDVLSLLNSLGIETGVDAEKLKKASDFIRKALVTPPPQNGQKFAP